jgi:drug/metabolite transporter (DMT)-like permease
MTTPTSLAAATADRWEAPKSPSRHHIALVLVAVASLALGGVLVRTSEVGPVATGGYRSLLAVPLLVMVSRLTSDQQQRKERVPWKRRDHALVALGGVFLACDLCLWNISFFYTTLAEANLLANLLPFVIAPLSYLIFREKIPHLLALPALMAIVGLYIIALLGTGINPRHLRGDLLALGTAVFYGLFLVTAKELRIRHDAQRMMAYLSVYCAGTCFVVAFVRGEGLLPRTVHGWGLVVLLAVTSQILGQTLMAHSVKFLSLQLASIFALLQPVAAAIYALIFFGEGLDSVQVMGIGILLISIYWAKLILEKQSAPLND